MADSEPILVNGNGTPYLAIFNGTGSPIMDELNSIPIGMEVEDFEYKYTEGKGDKGKFTIITNWVNIVDVQELQFKMPLRIQWGWIFPDGSFKSSPLRVVNIKEHRIEFTPDGVKFTIHFADAKMFLEASPSVFVGNQTEYVEVFKELAMGRFSVVKVDYRIKQGTKLVIQEQLDCDGKENQRKK